MNEKTKKLTFLALSVTLALILSYLEHLLPPLFTAVPGIKLGLPNLVIITLLYRYGVKEAATVSALRLLLVFLLFGSPLTSVYSLAGATLSLLLMAIMKKIKLFSTVGVSVIGAVMHNLGQILVAIFLFDSLEIGYYMLILTVTGVIAGALIGLTAASLQKRLNTLLK